MTPRVLFCASVAALRSAWGRPSHVRHRAAACAAGASVSREPCPMVFSSYPFLFGFLPVVLALCWG
ncbi:hypothetical protein, partial [Geminicoccus harenae]|uniref:hypothetical protein n=1 Tax=Geminicoccus harenae TaxID=2498453 RepID=UPI001C94416E